MSKLTPFLNATAPQWEALADKLSSPDLNALASEARSAAQLYAELAEYLECRSMPASHAAARKQAQTRLKKVRAALGYSYP